MDRNSPEFKALKEKWYARLKEKGFDDIEQLDGRLKCWDSSAFSAPSHFDPRRMRARAEYYRIAEHFLNDHSFTSRTEKKIWLLHAEGASVREIVLKINGSARKVYKRLVHETIQRLAKQMLKEYNESE